MSRTNEKSQSAVLRFMPAWPGKVLRFYVEGFRSMTVGRKLWLLILIKLFVLFFVFKLFFFPDILSRDYDTDRERADAVRSSLLDRR